MEIQRTKNRIIKNKMFKTNIPEGIKEIARNIGDIPVGIIPEVIKKTTRNDGLSSSPSETSTTSASAPEVTIFDTNTPKETIAKHDFNKALQVEEQVKGYYDDSVKTYQEAQSKLDAEQKKIFRNPKKIKELTEERDKALDAMQQTDSVYKEAKEKRQEAYENFTAAKQEGQKSTQDTTTLPPPNNTITTDTSSEKFSYHIGTFKNGGQDGWDDNGNPTTLSALSADTGVPVEVIAKQNGIENTDVIDAESDITITFNIEAVEGYKSDVNGIKTHLREILQEVEQVLSKLTSENDALFTQALADKLSEIQASLSNEFAILDDDANEYIKWLDKSIEKMREAMAAAEAAQGK